MFTFLPSQISDFSCGDTTSTFCTLLGDTPLVVIAWCGDWIVILTLPCAALNAPIAQICWIPQLLAIIPGGIHVTEPGARIGGIPDDPGVPVTSQLTHSEQGFPPVARVPHPCCYQLPSMLMSTLLDFAPVFAVPTPAMVPGSMPSLMDSVSTAFCGMLTVSCKLTILSSKCCC